MAASFISRNNSLEGYWAIGKLCSFAAAQQTDKLTIDLLAGANGEVTPPTEEFALPIHTYRRKLAAQLHGLGIPLEWAPRLVLTLLFNQPSGIENSSHYAQGQPYLCLCELTDDRGTTYRSRMGGYCRPHSQWSESRSGG